MAVQRRLVLLAGGRQWAEHVTSEALASWKHFVPEVRTLRADVRDPPAKAWMGQELDVVVLTAHRRRFLDTFGAVGGTLKSGGVLVFHTPPFDVWRRERLGARWCSLVESLCEDPQTSELITICREAEGIAGIPQLSSMIQSSHGARVHLDALTPNREQQDLINRILKIKTSRPLLIFGRRGRGKSACLGMAAAILLQRTGGQILVTSPSKEATSQAFWAAEKFLESAKLRRMSKYKLRFGKYGSMEFVEPQMLVRRDLTSSFLIIDEAAGFPVNLTAEILQAAGRVLLATTLDGADLSHKKEIM
ncbi:tRNA(Met) cytidine acetyltransferase TmcA [Durusdinium trenchii]|uniref:tRNA(Met) cytidine acetyltransferase TmcA n=1 Tax=Durusdinium trenchii TaxID=1381693 RepID=A0ABP0Q1X1_9DINO